MLKKIFTNLIVFLLVFAAVSIAADICFQARNTRGGADVTKWDGRPDFTVFWTAANNLTYHILRLPDGHPAVLPFYPLNSESRKNLIRCAKPGQYPVYDKNQTFYHFRYSPFIAFVLIPFVKIPYPPAALFTWSIMLNLVYLAALLLLANHLYNNFHIKPAHKYYILWVAFIATMRYYLMNIGQGQTDVLVAFLFVLFLMSYINKKDILCGILFALILQIKLLFFPVLLYFLFRRKMKLLISTGLSFACFLLIPACLLGLDMTVSLTRDWMEILGSSVPSQIQNYKNQSLAYAISVLSFKNSALKTIISPERLIFSLSVVLTLLAYMGTYLFKRSAAEQNDKKFKYLEIAILIMISLIFSPIAWEAHFVNLIIPAGIAALFALNSPKKKMPVILILGGIYFVLSCAFGTDITKYIPGINTLRFTNISLGTISLAALAVYSYKACTHTEKHSIKQEVRS